MSQQPSSHEANDHLASPTGEPHAHRNITANDTPTQRDPVPSQSPTITPSYSSIAIPSTGTAARMDWIRERLPLYLVMGSMNCSQSPEHVLEQAIAGGITIFQYREKGTQALQGSAYVELARRLQKICRQHQVPFIVNDDLELALELDADGLHVGQDDDPAAWIRHRLGPDKIVGVSAHSLTEASRAIAAGADYLGIGPIYPTTSKDDAQPVRGTEVIQQLRRSGLNIPLVGIGGIHDQNAAPVLTDGADGVAVISAIAAANEPSTAARHLKKVIKEHLPS